jgi:tetratricopeptide (TPR) repeat protein
MNSTVIQRALLLLFGIGVVGFVARPNLPLGAVLALWLILALLPKLIAEKDLVQQGNACCARGDYKTAIRCFNRAIQQQPGVAIAYYRRGIVQAILNDQQSAVKDLSQAVQIDPNFAQAYAERGIIYLDWGKPRQAFKDCDRAIQLNPKYERAYFGRGAARSYLGNCCCNQPPRFTTTLACCN